MPKRMLTEEEKDQYVLSGGVKCPFCKDGDVNRMSYPSPDRIGGFVEIHVGGATQEISCLGCGGHWTDVYSLVRIDQDEEAEGGGADGLAIKEG